jgi:RNA polymerase sigma-70 factor (ECF subfamily)
VLQQILAGPAAAKGPRVPLDDDFCEFYQANYGRVVAMATAMLGDRREAEDVAQEAFARALARWSRLRRYDQPGAWVRTVALRLAIDSARRAHRGVRATVALAAQRRPDDPEPSDALPFTALGAALRTLPLRERHVIVLHYLADLPVAEIARECGLPSGTVKARLAAGRKRLGQQLGCQPEEVPGAG